MVIIGRKTKFQDSRQRDISNLTRKDKHPYTIAIQALTINIISK